MVIRLPPPKLLWLYFCYKVLVVFVFVFPFLIGQSPYVEKAFAAGGAGFVTAQGTKLYLNGQQYQFTGVNAFNLATYPGYNAGCGGPVNDLDAFFSKLRPNSIIRLWTQF
jgi:hypothetical protein